MQTQRGSIGAGPAVASARDRAVGAALVLMALCAPALAAEADATAPHVGRFANVQNKVTSLDPGAREPKPAFIGKRIVIDEVEATAAASAATMTFGQAARIDIGEESTFKVTQDELAKQTGANASGLDLLVGKVRVFVSRYLSGGNEIRVNTPSAVVGIKGSEVVIEVLKDGTVVVTVISGSASVASKKAGGGKRELGAMQKLTVAGGGGPLPSPVQIGPSDIAPAREGTEPEPQADRTLPDEHLALTVPPGPPPSVSPTTLVTLTESPSSKGTVMRDPAAAVMPGPMTGNICECR